MQNVEILLQPLSVFHTSKYSTTGLYKKGVFSAKWSEAAPDAAPLLTGQKYSPKAAKNSLLMVYKDI